MGVTVITGASSGFGSGLAPLFAADGDHVVVLARRVERLNALVAEIRSAGGEASAYACDVSKAEDVADVFARIRSEVGEVDLLIANAGVGFQCGIDDYTTKAISDTYDVNLYGASYCIEQVLPGMKAKRGGQIVGISSLAGYRGLPKSVAYASSKAALTSLLESLRLESFRYNITVTTICPGYVKTEMTEKNEYPMPFLMELDVACKKMHRAIRKKKSKYSFPWQLASIVRIAYVFPNWLYDAALQRDSNPRT